ncbi:hypothetical protein BDV06DRAFT_226962 [Aspergillus oleicola]
MNGLYILLSGFTASLAAAGMCSLDLLRCRLLLSLFEVGHGMYPAAYISMGAAIRNAEILNIHRNVEGLTSCAETNGARHVWLGLVILDRYISLEMERAPSIPANTNRANKSMPRELSRLSQASNLLSDVISHVHGPSPYAHKSAEAIPILETLVSFRDSHEPQSPDTGLCPATALCSSAFMIILEFGYRYDHPTGKDCSPLAFALLEAEVQFLVSLDDMPQEPSMVEGNVPVFAIHSIGKAAIIILRHLKESEITDVPVSIERLKGLLRRISRRWHAAAAYFDKIQQEGNV